MTDAPQSTGTETLVSEIEAARARASESFTVAPSSYGAGYDGGYADALTEALSIVRSGGIAQRPANPDAVKMYADALAAANARIAELEARAWPIAQSSRTWDQGEHEGCGIDSQRAMARDQVRGDLTKIAAECHRAKWEFDVNGEERPPTKTALLELTSKAFNALHRIGDLALKLRDAAPQPASNADMARLSASEAACYRWREDTAEHRAMRAAFEDGAAHVVGAAQSPTAEQESLTERLRNPLWAHGDVPFEGPQLEKEENLAAMVEAADEIDRLRGIVQAAPNTPLDDPRVALGAIVDWWEHLPNDLRQDIEGSGGLPGCILRAERLASQPGCQYRASAYATAEPARPAKLTDDQIMEILRKVTKDELFSMLTCKRWKDGIDIDLPTFAAHWLADEFRAATALPSTDGAAP